MRYQIWVRKGQLCVPRIHNRSLSTFQVIISQQAHRQLHLAIRLRDQDHDVSPSARGKTHTYEGRSTIASMGGKKPQDLNPQRQNDSGRASARLHNENHPQLDGSKLHEASPWSCTTDFNLLQPHISGTNLFGWDERSRLVGTMRLLGI
ncbi:Uncharacterized protein HZ326_2136 [Fusarium oxysporum f. sp. albedinis]|nr:Uncharacterized protein HZ326_2136 [Fusarium oxysporum f. sp. albedinis]